MNNNLNEFRCTKNENQLWHVIWDFFLSSNTRIINSAFERLYFLKLFNQYYQCHNSAMCQFDNFEKHGVFIRPVGNHH